MTTPNPSSISIWPHPIRGIALDMDGLMFDTEPLYYEVGTELLARRGHTFTLETQQRMMGRPAKAAMLLLIDSFQLPDSWEDLMAESDDIYAGKVENNLQPMPGLLNFLDVIDDAAVPYGVATSSKRRFAEPMLDQFDLRPRLQFLLTGDDVTHGKPHPEMYLKAAEKLSLPAENMLVLEDSENGCKAAIAAETCAVAVPGEHSKDHCFDGTALTASSLVDPALLRLVIQ